MMNRRRFAQWLCGLLAISKWRVRGASSSESPFPGTQGETLRKIASVVLPSELTSAQCGDVAANFARYVREYHAGADTEHGYGVTHVRPKPASPADNYLVQLQGLSSNVTAEAIVRMIETSQINELPQVPAGKNVVVDLLSFYFRSSEANDLCYRSAIGRDKCRGLAGSANPPASLKGLA